MNTMRRPKTPEAFVAEAKTAPRYDALHPRVMKQINIRMPETDHYDLVAFINSLPRTSMQKFILEAIQEKIIRIRGEVGARGATEQ